MKLFTTKKLGALLFTCLFLGTLIPQLQTRASLPQQATTPKSKRALVFIVSRSDPSEPQSNMDAVVLVENGKFKQPYPEENEAAQKKFAASYFAPGQKYRVTFGGGEIGTATVQSSGIGCNNIHAVATVADSKQIPANLYALATDSETLGRKPTARRAPTVAEREAVMKMVRQFYRGRGTTPAMLALLKTTSLTATDLNGDGEFELIGSFVIETKTKARRDLLIIAEPQRYTQLQPAGPSAPAYRIGYADLQSYKLPPEGFDSASDFVDQLDIDGDGVAEVFVRNHGFDAYGYSILKKGPRGWRNVYNTTGDAC